MEAVLKPEHAPFNYACKNRRSTVGRPPTGLFKREVPQTDNKGNTSRAFLKIVEAKIRKKIDENRNMAKAITTCTNSDKPQCKDIRVWVETALPEFVGQARFHLSVAQSPYEKKTWFNIASLSSNSDLDPLGMPKLRSWSPLSPDEKKLADETLKEYIHTVKAEYPGAVKLERSEALIVLRFQHFEQYQAMMAQLPFLQYISSEKPTTDEVLAAAKELEKNIALEEKELDKISEVLKKEPKDPTEPLDPKALTLLKYTTQVEEALLENSKYCAIATSLVYTGDNRELGNTLALSLPILAVSMAAPPVAAALGASMAMGMGIGLGAGAVMGAGFIYDSQRVLDQERVRSFSQFYGGPENLEAERVRLAEADRDFQIISFPLNFAGAGVGSLAKQALVKTGAIKAASKIKLASKPKN